MHRDKQRQWNKILTMIEKMCNQIHKETKYFLTMHNKLDIVKSYTIIILLKLDFEKSKVNKNTIK